MSWSMTYSMSSQGKELRAQRRRHDTEKKLQVGFLQGKHRQGNTAAFILAKEQVTCGTNLHGESAAPTGMRCCQPSANAVSSWETHA